MEVKTDTKEKFHVITLKEANLSVNMTEELCRTLKTYLDAPVRNVVLNFKEVSSITEEAAELIASTQQLFYEKGASFVICNLDPSVESFLDEKDLLALLNQVPTESEAWDIVQMEEIERELLGDDDSDMMNDPDHKKDE